MKGHRGKGAGPNVEQKLDAGHGVTGGVGADAEPLRRTALDHAGCRLGGLPEVTHQHLRRLGVGHTPAAEQEHREHSAEKR